MVNAPRSEVEIYRNMAVLNSQSHSAIPVALSVPSTSEGSVRSVNCLFAFAVLLYCMVSMGCVFVFWGSRLLCQSFYVCCIQWQHSMCACWIASDGSKHFFGCFFHGILLKLTKNLQYYFKDMLYIKGILVSVFSRFVLGRFPQ